MEPEKAATITPLGKSGIKVLFNPTQYQLVEANEFSEIPIPGVEMPPLQFTRGTARTLAMQLFFDTYDPVLDNVSPGSDVRVYTSQVTNLLKVDPETHAPPICEFIWADFSFVGVLERADQRFTLFMPDGTPVRATIDVSFKEVGQAQPEQSRQRFSPDFTKRHIVRQGETLTAIAATRYDNPAHWRAIAIANNLDDPLALKPGQELVIPALEAALR